ncbi:prepilin-type N-terminal cleavage/methylation domain-containing protein [Persephonella sp. KM09-Lau-8]|uniref:prepilin-type N-terminal cleavage/methylation domain-containing protein n=1 Tax=Persephonella sp. KM09-Lau-8 TaxID=1158345 RepID=UPI0004968878|nr:prepilin-type N-terminal cleavage/methylation domain-containing protein [Persephonella sp. KM09-Lau-8]
MFKRNKKGFTIIEILVTLIIVALLLSAAYFTYIKIFGSYKEESESIEQQLEKVVGLELLRLDLEHIGYGVAYDATDKIIEWNNTQHILTIRSTLNNTNQSTFGWILCADGSLINDERKDTSNNNIVFIDTLTGLYNSVVTSLTCPSIGVHIGFPIATNANSCQVGSTNTCNTITYRKTNSNLPSHCNPNTFDLLRAVNGGSGNPLLHCIVDFVVTFDLDTDNDGTADSFGQNQPATDTNGNGQIDNSEIRAQLKRINFYAVMQEGGLNADYVYPSSSINIDGITFNLPANYQHYRWKVIKISVRPTGMFGGLEFK